MIGAGNVGFRDAAASCCTALSFREVPVKNTFIHFDVPHVAILSDRTVSHSSHYRARSCPAFAGPFCCVDSCSWEGATQLLAHAMAPPRTSEESSGVSMQPVQSAMPDWSYGQDSQGDSYFTPDSTPRGSCTATGHSIDDALSSCSSSWQSMAYTQDDASDPPRRVASGRTAAVLQSAARDGSANRRSSRNREVRLQMKNTFIDGVEENQNWRSPIQHFQRSSAQPPMQPSDEFVEYENNSSISTEPEPEAELDAEKELQYAGWTAGVEQGTHMGFEAMQQPQQFFAVGDTTAYSYQPFGDEYQDYSQTAGEQDECHQGQVALPLQQLVPPPYNASAVFAPACAIPQMAMPGTMFIPVSLAPMQQVMQTPLLMAPVQASCNDDMMTEVPPAATSADGGAQYSESSASSSAGRRTQRFEVGIEEDNCFRVVRRLIGPAGECMKRIVNESHGAKVWICGEGACPTAKQMRADQAAGPLSICISAMSGTSFDIAVRLVQELLTRIQADYQAYLEKQKKAESQGPANKSNAGRPMQRA